MSLTDFILHSQMEKRARAARANVIQMSMISSHKNEYLPKSEIKEPMHIEFRNDYDIEKMHKVIMSKIHHDLEEIPALNSKIEEIIVKINRCRTVVEIGGHLEEIKKLKEQKIRFGRKDRMEDYKSRANIILNKYRNTPRPPIVIGSGMSKCYYPTELDLERIEIIVSFLKIAQEFLKLTYVCTGYHMYDPVHRCKECNLDLTNIPCNSNSCQICPECSTNNAFRSSFIGDETSSSSSAATIKYKSYEDASNFQKARGRYFGQIKPKVDLDKLTIALDKYFISNSYPHIIRSEIFNQPRDEKGRHVDTSIKLLQRALKATGYSCYNDMNYITHYYWGWSLPEGSDKEDMILNIFNKTQDVWYMMTPEEKGRSSNIPVQYRLFKILQILNISCSIEDFKMSDPNNVQQYDNTWRVICDRCNDPNIKFIPT